MSRDIVDRVGSAVMVSDEDLEQARARWPGVEVSAERLADYVAARGGDTTELHIGALYLACACADSDARAIAAFVETFAKEIDVALRRLVPTHARADDVRSAVLGKLFTGSPPKIAAYSGRGSLAHWVRAVAAREALGHQRTDARREGLLDAAGPAVADHDPELDFLKQRYRTEFALAFEAAVAELAPEDRMTLKLRFVDGLTLEQVAAVTGVHRATAVRALSRIRDALLHGTRNAMRLRLDLEPEELESIVRLIRSNFEVSVSRMLRDDG